MSQSNHSIQRKLTSAILMTSVTVLLLTGAGFVSYELITFDRWLKNYLGTLGEVIADNSAAALEFGDARVAEETLASVEAEPHVKAAAIYGSNGLLFATWPRHLARHQLPPRPEPEGFYDEPGYLTIFLPMDREDPALGTLFLRADLGARAERFGPYAVIVFMVLGASVFVAVLLSRFLQRGISMPLLALADTAKEVSTRRDYSVRAQKFSEDEVGALTDAFNLMLTQIQERDAALRQNEERFRQLANTVPAFVWTCNGEGRAIYYNEPWYDYTGLTPEASLGDRWSQSLHPEDRERYVRAWFEAVANGRTFSAEARFRRRDGVYLWFLSRALPTRNADGQITTWFGTSTDIEEKKRAEDEISQLNVTLENRVKERTAQLEASNRELEAFSYSVAHDLRAPLRSIDGFNQALLEDYGSLLPPEAKDLIQRARLSSQRMSQLIDDLLNLSRVARAELRQQSINLSDIASQIAADLQKRDPSRAVHWDIEERLHAVGDDRLLRLAMENLLENAFKFTRHQPKARIEFGSSVRDGRRVLFVRDNGAGFKMEYAGKLFGPFQRLHSMNEYPGTGIGLATVHRILARHGGTIWPEAELGKGATFYFTLPEPSQGSETLKPTKKPEASLPRASQSAVSVG
jgi:PAS domain S-box-containing protein